LVIDESKLDETKDESLYQHPSYELYRRDRVGKGGGLMVYVKKTFNRQEFLSTKKIISLVINADESKMGIIACYRPPYTHNETDFYSSLDDQIKSLDKFYTSFVSILQNFGQS